MTTGYTQYIKEGNISFPEFAMKCARAFGALIEMRDDSLDAQIPNEIKPSEYHKEEMERMQKELDIANAMTLEEAKTKAAEEFEDVVIRQRRYIIQNYILRRKYEDMLHKVKMWQPPTSEHINIKMFMIGQIESSINFDCTYVPEDPIEKSSEVWLKEHQEKCHRDLDNHIKEWHEELKRSIERTEWIKELKKSLI